MIIYIRNRLRNNLPECKRLQNSQKNIPKTIMLTTVNKNTIPEHILKQYDIYAFDYEITLFDDADCVAFLKREYHVDVLNKFESLELGAHKADLFRYAYLLKHGGLYLDVKTILIKNLNELVDHKSFVCYLVKTENNNMIYNGILCTPPENPIFLALLKDIVYGRPLTHYLQYCKNALLILEKNYLKSITRRGFYSSIGYDVPDIWIWYESFFDKSFCNGKIDRHGACSYITDEHNAKIMLVRDATYKKPDGWV
jgi:hypothetical protein